MTSIIKQALTISISYAFLVAALSYIATLQWVAIMVDGVQTQTLTGWEAVSYLVSEGGFLSYLSDLLPHYLFFVLVIFIALVIQGLIHARKTNS